MDGIWAHLKRQKKDKKRESSSTWTQVKRVVEEENAIISSRQQKLQDITPRVQIADAFTVQEWQQQLWDEVSISIARFEVETKQMAADLIGDAGGICNMAADETNRIEEAVQREKEKQQEWLEERKKDYDKEMRAALKRYIQEKVTIPQAAWDNLVQTSSVDKQRWRLATSPNISRNSTESERIDSPGPYGGFTNTAAPQSSSVLFSSSSSTPTPSDAVPQINASVDPAVGTEQSAESKISIRRESGTVLCTITANPGDTLASIRERLTCITPGFRFLRPSGNPFALKMEGNTKLMQLGLKAITISYE